MLHQGKSALPSISAETDPHLQFYLRMFEEDESYRLQIWGNSDCVGSYEANVNLRHARAEAVENLLGPHARARVMLRGMAALGDYIDSNSTMTGRAFNRSVVIEYANEPETPSPSPGR